MKLIAIDIGNTRSKVALMQDADVVDQFSFNSIDFESHVSSILALRATDVIVSNVSGVPASQLLGADSSKKIIELQADTPLPFQSSYTNTLGNDRKAVLAALQKQFPGQHSLGITMGSCITYSFLEQGRYFKGGSISPGMQMRFNAMHQFTGRLPLAHADTGISLIGNNTIAALQSGVVYGIINEIEGFIEMYKNLYDKINVVLTGGDSAYFSSRLKCKIFADDNLIFKGLYALYTFQQT